MHVAINSRFLSYQLEGIGNYTWQMIQYWAEMHPECKFSILLDRNNDYKFLHPNVHKVVLGPKVSHAPSIYWWNQRSIPAWVKAHQPDVFFSPTNFLPLNLKIPTLLTVHDIGPIVHPEFYRKRDRFYYQFYEQKMMRKANKIVTVSSFCKDEFTTHVKRLDSTDVEVVYNGFSKPPAITEQQQQDFLKKYNLKPGYIFYLGSIHPRKNVANLIKSFEHYRAQGGNRTLLIVGRPAWLIEDVLELLNTSIYKAHIHQINYLDEEEKSCAYHASSLFAYMSLYEGFGLPVLEAMSCNIPVLTSEHSAMEEIGGKYVFTADPNDPKMIGNKMLSIISANYENRIAAGARHASTFSWKKCAKETWDVLEQTLVEET